MSYNFRNVRVFSLALSLLMLVGVSQSYAQYVCPAGLQYAGSDFVNSNVGQGNALTLLRVAIPHDRDRSYSQSTTAGRIVGSDSAGRVATTNWNGQHNIKGISIDVNGNYYYALGVDVLGKSGKPRVIAEMDSDGNIAQEFLEIGAYCGPGGNGEGCTAKVTVCYKPL